MRDTLFKLNTICELQSVEGEVFSWNPNYKQSITKIRFTRRLSATFTRTAHAKFGHKIINMISVAEMKDPPGMRRDTLPKYGLTSVWTTIISYSIVTGLAT